MPGRDAQYGADLVQQGRGGEGLLDEGQLLVVHTSVAQRVGGGTRHMQNRHSGSYLGYQLSQRGAGHAGHHGVGEQQLEVPE